MIELKIENANPTGVSVIGCDLSISFAATAENVDALNKQIGIMSKENPGIVFELRTQLREKYSCSICGRQEFVGYGETPPKCRCNPHQKWVKEER